MSTTRPHDTSYTPEPSGEGRESPPECRTGTDVLNLLNFTKWWRKVSRKNQCKDSTSDGWDAGVDECLLAAETLRLDPEFVTEYAKGYNEAIETFVAVVKKMVR